MQRQVRAHTFLAWIALPVCAVGLAIGLVGCKRLPPSKPASEWTPQEARGAAVFQQHCARCHYPTTTHGMNGPGLQAITKMKAMPSGAPPTDERLAALILRGHGMMPATPLDDEQLQDLLAYLHTL
jgi:mono/diheme cytochrome c family protein